MTLINFFLLKYFFPAHSSAIPCILKPFNSGLVCVCNSTYCDTLEFKYPPKSGDVVILSTSKNGLRFHETHAKFSNQKTFKINDGTFNYGTSSGETNKNEYVEKFMHIIEKFVGTDEPIDSIVNIEVNRSEKYQKIMGFGGAFTGAVSFHLNSMSKELTDHVYRGYYSKDVGNGFNFMRFPIGGCDFDISPWAYHEEPQHDPYLSNFTSLDDRDLKKISQIRELKKISGNNNIKVVGAAWSPPKWMKTNNEWTGFSALRDEYYQTWADYHVKYLELMANNNFPFWGISTGNEPLNGVLFPYFVKFMSLGWTPDTQGQFIANNLGPTMKKSSVTKNVKILGGDDQRYTLPMWFQRMDKITPNATEFLDGIAVHFYADKEVPASMLSETASLYPDKFIISTEACAGDKPWDVHGPVLGSWTRFELYTLDIIEDLNNFVSAWIDWNLILDEEGGPNYARNYVS